MAPLRAVAVLAMAAVLTACGGGSGVTQVPAPSAPKVRATPLEYGYFGVDGDQIDETADHVTFVQAMDWGDWRLADYDAFRTSTTITQLQEAKARGIRNAWVAVGYLVFTMAPGCPGGSCLSPRADAIPRLLAFKQQLDAAAVLDMVRVLYPVDEPALYGLTDATLSPTLQAIKGAWPDVKLGVIYSAPPYPGLARYDIIGRDDYGIGAAVLNELPPITAPQEHLLVPGGADPWQADPQPFYDYAQAHADVYGIMPFVWFDRPAGPNSGPGIRSNGMASAYRSIGAAIAAQSRPG